MTTLYKLRIKSPTGTAQAEFVDFRALAYTKRVNDPGLLTFDVDGDHRVVSILDDSLDNIVEVWRRDIDVGEDWYVDFRGLFRDELRSADDDGNTTFRAFCPGPLSLLRRSIVAYKQGVSNRSEFTAVPVETIMNTLVKYNATSSGTTGDGRIRNVDLTRVSVETNGAYGTSIDLSCAWRPLLDILQEITRLAPGDFDLVYVSADDWEYRFYEGHIGTDRTATVIFSLDWGNMASPSYTKNRLNERTAAVTVGPGDEASAYITTRIPTYSHHETNYNSVEFFVDARDAQTNDEVNAIGDAAIWEARASSTLTFKVLQTQGSRYGREYFLGDRVTAKYQEITQELKIVAVSVSIDGSTGQELIEIEMGEP